MVAVTTEKATDGDADAADSKNAANFKRAIDLMVIDLEKVQLMWPEFCMQRGKPEDRHKRIFGFGEVGLHAATLISDLILRYPPLEPARRPKRCTPGGVSIRPILDNGPSQVRPDSEGSHVGNHALRVASEARDLPRAGTSQENQTHGVEFDVPSQVTTSHFSAFPSKFMPRGWAMRNIREATCPHQMAYGRHSPMVVWGPCDWQDCQPYMHTI